MERNKERAAAVIRLLEHKTLGIMLGLGIVFLGLSVWSYLFVVLFLYCFMEWHDMNGYKFSACNGNTKDDYTPDNQYRERPVENVMAYKIDNAITGAILLLFTLALVYFWYGIPEMIWVFVITLLWYFSGVKEVFFYNPFDKNFVINPDIWWYSFTFYGVYQYKIRLWFGSKGTMSGRDALWQAFIGIFVSIILTIIWILKWELLLANLTGYHF